MRLLLDVGNTRLKWRLLQDGRVMAEGACPTDGDMAGAWTDLPAPGHIAGCCVASSAVQEAVESRCHQLWTLPIAWLQPGEQGQGLRNHYRAPTLGPDRWASAIAAFDFLRESEASSALAVNAGTAITIDAVTAAGDYLGGSIVPGLRLMREALASGTARLPLGEGEVRALPQATADAIMTGVVDAACGAIERLRQRLPQPAICLLSGGDALQLIPHLPGPVQKVENLVLDGLQVITR